MSRAQGTWVTILPKIICHWDPGKRGKRGPGEKVLEKIMAKNFPKFVKYINLQI